MKLKFGKLSVTVETDGASPQPWGGGSATLVTRYRVVVRRGKVRYSSPAWGSINDYDRGKEDHAGIGAMVVDELFSASADPDEFITMAIADAAGREALKRGKAAEKTCAVARRIGYDALEEAVSDARERGLL